MDSIATRARLSRLLILAEPDFVACCEAAMAVGCSQYYATRYYLELDIAEKGAVHNKIAFRYKPPTEKPCDIIPPSNKP